MAGRHTAPAIADFDPSTTAEPERITVGELCDRYQALTMRLCGSMAESIHVIVPPIATPGSSSK